MTKQQANRCGTAVRDRYRRIIASRREDCGICHQPIDYSIRDHLNGGYFTIDHIQPINRGGLDVLDNLQPAHRKCNRAKSDLLPGERRGQKPEPLPVIRFVTSRKW